MSYVWWLLTLLWPWPWSDSIKKHNIDYIVIVIYYKDLHIFQLFAEASSRQLISCELNVWMRKVKESLKDKNSYKKFLKKLKTHVEE